MTETSKLGVFLSIEHDQRIDLTSDGQVIRGRETYIREYVGMLESGLMAQLSNAAYKVLHALALRARILGDSRRAGAEEEFKELCELGIVTDADKGELFCFPSREQLLKDTGIGSVHTIDTALDELAELNLIRRITVAQPRFGRGYFGSNIYLIHPGSFIGKFDSGTGKQKLLPVEEATGEQKVLPAGEADGEQKLHPVSEESGEQLVLPAEETESSLRNTANRALKRQDLLTTTTTGAAALEGLGLDESEQTEMQALLMLITEHSKHSPSKADARRWKTLADQFGKLADARSITPIRLVQQAVEEALDAGSAHDGYVAPKLARAILSRWAKEQVGGSPPKLAAKQEIPPAVQVYRQVRRRFPAQELWERIGQTVGTDESLLAFWQEILTTWVARGYNPLNVDGPLEWFKANAIPLRNTPGPTASNGAGLDVPLRSGGRDAVHNGQDAPPALTQRPIERLEVIQERLRQNSHVQEPGEPARDNGAERKGVS